MEGGKKAIQAKIPEKEAPSKNKEGRPKSPNEGEPTRKKEENEQKENIFRHLQELELTTDNQTVGETNAINVDKESNVKRECGSHEEAKNKMRVHPHRKNAITQQGMNAETSDGHCWIRDDELNKLMRSTLLAGEKNAQRTCTPSSPMNGFNPGKTKRKGYGSGKKTKLKIKIRDPTKSPK